MANERRLLSVQCKVSFKFPSVSVRCSKMHIQDTGDELLFRRSKRNDSKEANNKFTTYPLPVPIYFQGRSQYRVECAEKNRSRSMS